MLSDYEKIVLEKLNRLETILTKPKPPMGLSLLFDSEKCSVCGSEKCQGIQNPDRCPEETCQ